MTSRNLFSKLIKEDLKRRIWTIALASLIFFLCLPVYCAIILGNYDNSEMPRTKLIESITETLKSQSMLLVSITVIGAVICGLSSFFYLHSKKKVDLYHSIPVRRENLFTVYYINGLLIYLIPYIFNLVLCFVILQINGFMSLNIFNIMLSAMLVNFVYYCLLYTLVVIAAMLTGNFVINCLGAGVFLLYGPMLKVIKELYFNDFFDTYYSADTRRSMFLFLSPIFSYFDAVRRAVLESDKGIIKNLIGILIITIIFIGIALFLYKKRPSEAAGKAMAFSISKPIIKFLLVIPITLGGGILFREIAASGSDGWLLFGLIFSFILSYAIIEIIYNFDIRCAFHNKRHIIFCALAVLLIAGVFRFDVFRYDTYIPAKDKVESMSVAITGMDDDMSYYRADLDGSSNIGYQLKSMKLTDFDVAYELAEYGMENPVKEMNEINPYNYNVKYTLKSGRTIYRTYEIKKEDRYEDLKQIYASKEYKEGHYPIYKWKSQDIVLVSSDNYIGNKDFSLNSEEKQQLLEIYKEELNQLTLDDIKDTVPIASLSFEFKDNRSDYNVYPSFVNTIDFLKNHGFNANESMDENNISEIVITNNELLNKNSIDSNSITTVEVPVTVSFTDKSQIKEIYAALVPNNYYWDNNSIIDTNEYVDVSVTFIQDAYGNRSQDSFYFKKGQIPDFVKTALSIKED